MSESTGRPRIFVSYSHRGDGPRWKAALLNALQVFERHHLLDVWHDEQIRLGSCWDDDIGQAMRSARLAVVLLTDEALRSDFIRLVELPFLAGRQKAEGFPVFPVVCEPCDWQAHDWLLATQAPNASRPLSELPQDRIDGVLRHLAAEVAERISRDTFAGSAAFEPRDETTRTYVDRFPLRHGGTGEERLIGREQELALLDLAYTDPHTAVVSLVAWGGVGKSMLVRTWLLRLARAGWRGARRVYTWSFYSQGAREDRQVSEDAFLAHALGWFGVACEPTLPPWEKGRLLADAVARERTLLVLDGVEPLQYPPGPMGGRLRAPGLQALLKDLARKAAGGDCQGLCVVTTRESLPDLADFARRAGAAWGSVLGVDLCNLADDAELLAASREVGGHALTLNLLGRYLARAHGGDVRRRDRVAFADADREEQGGTTSRMLAAFENWFAEGGEFGARQLAVLRILGLFDRPAPAGCLDTLRLPPAIPGLTDPLFHTTGGFLGWGKRHRPIGDQDWNNATSFLADFGLVVSQAGEAAGDRSLDCHPLIREHFASQTRGRYIASWHAAHRRLHLYLRDTTRQQPDTLEGLQPLYQAVSHGCHAGMQPEACRLYIDRMLRGQDAYTVGRLGAHGSDLGAIACFFERPWGTISPRLAGSDQSFLLHQAAFSLRAVGRLGEAVEPMRAAVEMAARHGGWAHAATWASNLSELELALGNIGRAVECARQSSTYILRGGDSDRLMISMAASADAMHQAGDLAEANRLFHEAEALQSEVEPPYPLLYSARGYKYCDLLLAGPERAAWHPLGRGGPPPSEFVSKHRATLQDVQKRMARIVGWRAIPGWRDTLLDLALDQLTLGRVALYGAVLGEIADSPARTTSGGRPPGGSATPSGFSDAERELDAAVHGLRRAGTTHHIPRGLMTRAWLRARLGDAAGARADLDEAWDIAERGSMRLHMADVHLHRARLFWHGTSYPWMSPNEDLVLQRR